MKTVSSGFRIPWEEFNQVLRGEQIFHAQYCPAKKDACLGVWLDRWCYCDSYVETSGETAPDGGLNLGGALRKCL